MTSPWKTTDDLARHLGFMKNGQPDRKACWQFLDRAGVPMRRRGRQIVAHLEDADAALKQRRKDVSA